MTQPPFTLKVKTCSPPGRCEEIVCRDVLRALGKTRMVYDAAWGSRRIVLKVFAKFGKAPYHAMREWRGLRQLEARQVNSPRPLFFGRSPEGWVVATEWLDDAVTAGRLWRTAGVIEERVQMLSLLARELARHHDRGVIQPDMHLENFMVRGREVFALDPAMMRFRRGPIGRRRSIGQVAQLVCALPEEAGAAIESVFREYAEGRSWTIGPQDMERFRAEHGRRRHGAIERGLRKSLRTNRRHQAIRQGPWRGLADRSFSEGLNLDEITVGLDEAMERGRILKEGRTAFVSRVTLAGVEVVVKRYNHRGLAHAVRHTLKGSRARRSWLNGNRLCLLGIPAPKPLAYVERRKGPFLWQSYFLQQYVSGGSLRDFLLKREVDEAERKAVMNEVLAVLAGLARCRITHGDLKHTNIILSESGPVLIDLDGMKRHSFTLTYRIAAAKDRARLTSEGLSTLGSE